MSSSGFKINSTLFNSKILNTISTRSDGGVQNNINTFDTQSDPVYLQIFVEQYSHCV